MTDKELPPYFKQYLDEKFETLSDTVDRVETKLIKMNGSVARIKEIQNSHVRDIAEQKLWNVRLIKAVVLTITLGSTIWVKESRDLLIDIFRLLLGI